jgi:hypothetical protein
MKHLRSSNDDNDDRGTKKPLVVNPHIARDTWLKRSSDEAWIRGILPQMNPFMAMDVFKYEPRIADALATDQTPTGRELWRAYFVNIFPPKLLYDDIPNNDGALLRIKDTVTPRIFAELTTIFQMVNRRQFGFERGYRNSVLWLWTAFRQLAKEGTKGYKADIVSNPIEHVRELATIIKYTVPDNRDATTPCDVDIRLIDGNRLMKRVSIPESIQKYLTYSMNALSSERQQQLYDRIGPMIDMMIIINFYISIYNNPVRYTIVIDDPTMSILQQCINWAKSVHRIPQYTMQRTPEETVALVTTTFPTAPDVGPGIFTGSQCVQCGEVAQLVCDGCKLSTYCTYECGKSGCKYC